MTVRSSAEAPGSRPPVGASQPDDPWVCACTVRIVRIVDVAETPAGLSEAERARAAGYLNADARHRFVAGALMVRQVAGLALGIPARDVEVDRTCDRCGRQHGRPRVPRSGLHLSVSHCDDLLLVAMTEEAPVGVDVENVRSRTWVDLGSLIAQVCDPAEIPHVHSPRDLLVCWTRKEAALKASGHGLRVPPADVVVTPPDRAAGLLEWRGHPRSDSQMADLDLGPDHVAALAVLTARPIAVTLVADEAVAGSRS